MDIFLANEMLSYVLAEAPIYTALGGAGYLAWRFVRAYERRAVAPDRLEAITDRIRLLEDTVDQVEDRVDRSDELHRFTTRVLAGYVANAPGTEVRAKF